MSGSSKKSVSLIAVRSLDVGGKEEKETEDKNNNNSSNNAISVKDDSNGEKVEEEVKDTPVKYGDSGR